MPKYLYRLLSQDEIKNNSVKSVSGENFSLEEYISRNDSHKNAVISMTASLEYAIGHGMSDASVDFNHRKIAIIDVSRLDRESLIDVHTMSNYLSQIGFGENRHGMVPKHEGCFSKSHYSARALEFLYKDNLPLIAYKIFDIKTLMGFLDIVYKNHQFHEDGYPFISTDKVSHYNFNIGYKLENMGVREKKSRSTRYEHNWLYSHSCFCHSLGIYESYQEFEHNLFNGVYDWEKPCEKEREILREAYLRIENTESHNLRKKVDLVIYNILHRGLIPPATNRYNSLYLLVKENLEDMFRQ